MTRKGLPLSFTVVTLVAAACGGGGGEPIPAPSPRAAATPAPTAAPAPCSPSGTTLKLSAKGVAYNKTCLAAPANQPFTIEFHVKPQKNLPPAEAADANSHNVSIKSADSSKVFFTGKVIKVLKNEATTDYHVTPLAVGTYVFKCDVHPELMHGTFVVS
jgi:cupredoxin-like protein